MGAWWIDVLGMIVTVLPLLYVSAVLLAKKHSGGIMIGGIAIFLGVALILDLEYSLGFAVAPEWWHM